MCQVLLVCISYSVVGSGRLVSRAIRVLRVCAMPRMSASDAKTKGVKRKQESQDGKGTKRAKHAPSQQPTRLSDFVKNELVSAAPADAFKAGLTSCVLRRATGTWKGSHCLRRSCAWPTLSKSGPRRSSSTSTHVETGQTLLK